MNELVLRAGRRLKGSGDVFALDAWRLLALAVLLLLLSFSADLRAVTLQALSDAYLQVSVFVAGTLFIAYETERLFKADIGRMLDRSGAMQIPLAALLGALPGCGGAIIVVTQYTRGYLSFGSVVTVLVATMGDAAFLLIAREPTTALFVISVSLTAGVLTGWVVDALHGRDFLRQKVRAAPAFEEDEAAERAREPMLSVGLRRLWIALLLPGAVLGICVAFQVDSDRLLFGPLAEYEPTLWIGVAGALLCFVMWVFSPSPNSHTRSMTGRFRNMSSWYRTLLDTNFVTAWVVFDFLAYELAVHFSGGGLERMFMVWAPIMPLVAILVGFLPGCGPQVVVTTLYVTGVVPLSAQLGNSIANDGDALFPAIALAPRAAIVATIYSGIPAFLVGYGYFFLFEWAG